MVNRNGLLSLLSTQQIDTARNAESDDAPIRSIEVDKIDRPLVLNKGAMITSLHSKHSFAAEHHHKRGLSLDSR